MGGGNVCGAESRTHYLFRIGETFRRRGFGANFGTGDVPNDYFRFRSIDQSRTGEGRRSGF